MPEFVSVENVRISLLPATLFQRFAAITIDIVLVLIVMGLSSLVVYSFYTRELDPFIPLFSLFFLLPSRPRRNHLQRAHDRQALSSAARGANRRQRSDGLDAHPALFPVVDRRFRQFRQRVVVDFRHEVAPPLGRFGPPARLWRKAVRTTATALRCTLSMTCPTMSAPSRASIASMPAAPPSSRVLWVPSPCIAKHSTPAISPVASSLWSAVACPRKPMYTISPPCSTPTATPPDLRHNSPLPLPLHRDRCSNERRSRCFCEGVQNLRF